ncbi:MAG: hypothetical protein IKB88_02470 [Clostridia bacterium]|nr:hypothetical protein [Clostridia bacterium]
MKEKLTVSLFGHRFIDEHNAVEGKLYELLRIVMQNGNREIEFLLGRNGDFDLMAASVIRKLKKETGNENAFLTLVLPYETAELRNNTESFESYYDSIEICDSQNFKFAIVARNRDMIDRSDMVVVYVKNESGGAFQALKYAEKNQKRIINLYYTQNEE